MDANGNPVISYYDARTGDLKVAHCDDPNCDVGGDSIVGVDTEGKVGEHTSLMLDANGNPVISYSGNNIITRDLKVAHCDDPNCDPGGDSTFTVDIGGAVGAFTSLVLDANGNPVISYSDESSFDGTFDLKVAHCDNVNCEPPVDTTTPARATMEPVSSTVLVGTDANLTVTVFNGQDDPLPGASVTIFTDAGVAAFGTTGDDGTATVTVTADQPGSVFYSATVNGIPGFAWAIVTYGTVPSIADTTITGEVGEVLIVRLPVSGLPEPTVTVSALPAGLFFTTGFGWFIGGAPSVAGTTTVEVTATNALGSVTTDITIIVNSANDAPVALDASATTDEDTAVTIAPSTSDADGDALTLEIASDPAHGTAAVNGSGGITYSPAADYVGEDLFTYTASDGAATSAAATVTVTVECRQRRPGGVGRGRRRRTRTPR